MHKPALIAIAILASASLTSCGYPSIDACEESTGAVCHIGLFDGKAHQGVGIDINSPAGTALLSTTISNMSHPAPIQPYYLPPPINYGASHSSITCSSIGTELTGTISCN